MQIKERGNKIQLIRTEYSKKTKRTIGKVFASFDKRLSSIDSLPAHVKTLISSDYNGIDEIQQLNDYFRKRKEIKKKQWNETHLKNVSEYMRRATKALDDDDWSEYFSDRHATELYERIDSLKKALKKAGFDKPVKHIKQIPKDTRQVDMVEFFSNNFSSIDTSSNILH